MSPEEEKIVPLRYPVLGCVSEELKLDITAEKKVQQRLVFPSPSPPFLPCPSSSSLRFSRNIVGLCVNSKGDKGGGGNGRYNHDEIDKISAGPEVGILKTKENLLSILKIHSTGVSAGGVRVCVCASVACVEYVNVWWMVWYSMEAEHLKSPYVDIHVHTEVCRLDRGGCPAANKQHATRRNRRSLYLRRLDKKPEFEITTFFCNIFLSTEKNSEFCGWLIRLSLFAH